MALATEDEYHRSVAENRAQQTVRSSPEIDLARYELRRLLDRALANRATETERKAIKYVGMVYLLNQRDSSIADQFPGSTRDQRYQWKKRVLDALWEVASPTLQDFLASKGPRAMEKREVRNGKPVAHKSEEATVTNAPSKAASRGSADG